MLTSYGEKLSLLGSRTTAVQYVDKLISAKLPYQHGQRHLVDAFVKTTATVLVPGWKIGRVLC